MNHAANTGANPIRLLVVDDSDLILQLLDLQLSREGFIVAIASNGQAAVEWCEQHGQPDLLLTDVCMPGIDGPALYKTLETRFPGIPVLFMSGNAAFSSTMPFVRKPFRFDELASMIRASLSVESVEQDAD